MGNYHTVHPSDIFFFNSIYQLFSGSSRNHPFRKHNVMSSNAVLRPTNHSPNTQLTVAYDKGKQHLLTDGKLEGAFILHVVGTTAVHLHCHLNMANVTGCPCRFYNSLQSLNSCSLHRVSPWPSLAQSGPVWSMTHICWV